MIASKNTFVSMPIVNRHKISPTLKTPGEFFGEKRVRIILSGFEHAHFSLWKWNHFVFEIFMKCAQHKLRSLRLTDCRASFIILGIGVLTDDYFRRSFCKILWGMICYTGCKKNWQCRDRGEFLGLLEGTWSMYALCFFVVWLSQ